MPTTTVNGVAMHYLEKGTGRPLVLLHGFPLDATVWSHQVDALSDRYRVIAPDLLGFGQSRSDAPFTLESQAAAVHELLRQIDALPCVLAGLSMGGYVALAYQRRYPTDLKGLVLVDTKASGDTAEGRAGREQMVDLVRSRGSKAVADKMMPNMLSTQTCAQKPEVQERLRQIMEACPPKTIEHACIAMRDREDRVEQLGSIGDPVLIVVGEHDAIIPVDLCRKMDECIVHSKVEVIPGAGHMTPIEAPELTTAALRAFCDAVYAGGTVYPAKDAKDCRRETDTGW